MPLEDNIPELAPEHRDLLMLLRAAVDGTAPPSPPVNWEKVLEIARFHQVDMFLYPAVAGWPKEFQPSEDLMSRWRSAFFTAVVKYEQASAQLKEILSALHDADIPVIPLKGAWLAEKVYEDGAMRPMCDFDLLVPLEQLDRARTVFETLGYTTPDHYFDTARHKDIHYRHPDRPMMVELHFRIWHEGKTNVVSPDTDRLWVDPVEETLHGIPVLGFPAERQLVYLAQHILHHSLTIGLKAYLDLILLIQKTATEKEKIPAPINEQPSTNNCTQSATREHKTKVPQINADRRGFRSEKLEEEARALGIPFGAKIVLQVALDIADLEPTKGLAAFLSETETLPKERRTAFCSILQMTGESAGITPSIEAMQTAPPATRAKLALSRIFYNPNQLRTAYPEPVKRFGLVGGYIARARDLIRRRSRDWKNPKRKDDIENYNARHNLSEWIHKRDQSANP